MRSNQGGNGSYWASNIVGPLISKPIDYNTFYFIKVGSDYRNRISNFATEGTYAEAGKLPDWPELNKSDIDGMVMGRTGVSVEPVDWGIDFDGKVFLLVNGSVYSAADQFVSFCKDSGFATIVGSTTEGDGGGITPIWSQMPNTKLLFIYRVTYILNPDGSCNQEKGVTPDIYTDGDALEACLEHINAG
ncbi:MAG: S41 family peptidase [Clostridiaceae bacterium]|nr:S41 family peptidase [Clostridiaceae bacterium]